MDKSKSSYAILVVEDSKDLCTLIQTKLLRAGLQTHVAYDGVQAVEFLKNHWHQNILMLLDYKLGDMNARQLIAHLAQQKINVPFIVITGCGNEKIAVEMMRLGARDYITKDTAFIDILEPVIKSTVEELLTEDQLAKTGKALRESELRFQHEHNLLRTLIDNLPDLIYFKDTDGRFVVANKSVARFMGVAQPDQLLGKTDFDFYPHELASKYHKHEQNIINTARPQIDKEHLCLDTANRPKWFLSSKVPLIDDTGNVTGIVGLGRDITERKKAQDALKREQTHLLNHIPELRLRLLLENSPNIIVETDIDHKLISMNRTGRNFFLLTETTLKKGMDYPSLFPHQWQHLISTALDAAASGTAEKITVQAADPDQNLRWLDIIFSPITNTKGCVVRIIGTCWDISERVKREQKVLRLHRKMQNSLEHADKLLKAGHIASQIAHEIGNPLTLISSQIQRMACQKLPTDPDRMNKLLEHIDRISSLIRELSDLGRKSPLIALPEHIAPVIDNALDLAAHGKQFENIKVRKQIKPKLPRVKIDKNKITQVLLNLLLNAADACQANGSITIKTDTKAIVLKIDDRHVATEYLTISIKDSGKGIDPAAMERIFEPFFTTKPPDQGTGLGLAVSLSIIRQHHGWINVQSKPGRGANFTIYLPAQTSSQPQRSNIKTVQSAAPRPKRSSLAKHRG